MRAGKKLALFCVGGGAYVWLELLYRGRSHISMFGAGGLCFLLLGRLPRARMPAALRAGCGAGIITAVELATGLLVNRRYQVWDYRDQPMNFLGQICPAFTAAWVPVSLAAMALYEFADRRMEEWTLHLAEGSVG